MKDLRIISDKSGDPGFIIYDAIEDSGLLLLQRLYVLLLSDTGEAYRGEGGSTLLRFLDGGNRPTDDIMNSLLAINCANALNMLTPEDRNNISSFTGLCTDGDIVCTLVLRDGTTIKGQLTNE